MSDWMRGCNRRGWEVRTGGVCAEGQRGSAGASGREARVGRGMWCDEIGRRGNQRGEAGDGPCPSSRGSQPVNNQASSTVLVRRGEGDFGELMERVDEVGAGHRARGRGARGSKGALGCTGESAELRGELGEGKEPKSRVDVPLLAVSESHLSK